jgi:hypothetical protein
MVSKINKEGESAYYETFYYDSYSNDAYNDFIGIRGSQPRI